MWGNYFVLCHPPLHVSTLLLWLWWELKFAGTTKLGWNVECPFRPLGVAIMSLLSPEFSSWDWSLNNILSDKYFNNFFHISFTDNVFSSKRTLSCQFMFVQKLFFHVTWTGSWTGTVFIVFMVRKYCLFWLDRHFFLFFFSLPFRKSFPTFPVLTD